MKPLVTVTTDVGTFTRRTARAYTHVVVVDNPMKPEGREPGWGVWAYSGRLELAAKAADQAAQHFADVRIYDIAGALVRLVRGQ